LPAFQLDFASKPVSEPVLCVLADLGWRVSS
jgi:hypothetical protein